MGSDRHGYYNPETNEVIDMVPKKDGKGLKNITIKEVRQMGLVPRVSAIIGELNNFQIVNYQIEQAIKACIAVPFTGNIDGLSPMLVDEALKDYFAVVKAKAGEHAKDAAEQGTAIHKAVYLGLKDGLVPTDPVQEKAYAAVKAFLGQITADDIELEHSLCSRELGFGGTPDIYCTADPAMLEQALGVSVTCEPRAWRVHVIIDMKSTTFSKYKKPYDSWVLQEGAYRLLTGSDDGTWLLQCVIDRDYGDVKWEVHDKPDDAAKAFSNLVNVWTWLHGYDPRTWSSE